MKIIVTEEQIKKIINNVYGNILFEETKPKPKNQTYTTVQDRLLTKNTLTGGELKIPKGTRFTAHQSGDRKETGGADFTASVDRMVDVGKFDSYAKVPQKQKLTHSTIFYCNGTNAGKFWNVASKSWYYDKTKVLSGYLSKNLCTKSYGDQYYWENMVKWSEQKQEKEEDAWALKNSPYVDATGKKVMYDKSTEFKKTYDFLKSQGLNVDGLMSSSMPRPLSTNHHFNLCALFSIKDITNFQANKIGWNNKECMSIGLSSLGNVKMKSKLLNTYDSSVGTLIDNQKSPLYTQFSNTVSPSYANFFLSDFYFQWGKLLNDINDSESSAATMYFPDGVYNFMTTYYGTPNVSKIKKTIESVNAGCQGGGLTPEQGHKMLSTLTFISAFIPVVGPFIAAGLGTVDAAILYSEGKKTEAALTVALSIIPFVGEIPALKGIGQEVFKSAATKLATKVPLNAEEISAFGKLTGAKAEFDILVKKWVASKASSPAVQEIVQVVKKKGEGYLVDKMSEKIGVPLKKPTAIAKDVTKDAAKYLAKKIDS